MASVADVSPNRQGRKSRELVLAAAERLMAEHGFEAATLDRIVKASGISPSSVYHYFGSKDGILLAVMERGARRFFADVPNPDRGTGDPAQHLAQIMRTAAQLLERHPGFMRLLVVFAVQPPSTNGADIQAVVWRVRELALARLREQLALAFGDKKSSATTEQLARFALAAFDGAFVASQADPTVGLESLLRPLAPALVAARASLLPAHRHGRRLRQTSST